MSSMDIACAGALWRVARIIGDFLTGALHRIVRRQEQELLRILQKDFKRRDPRVKAAALRRELLRRDETPKRVFRPLPAWAENRRLAW